MTNAVNLASAAGTGFFRNRIINGDMRIDQRNAGASVVQTNSAGYLLDRWFGGGVYGGTLTLQRLADAPSGFTNSQKVTVTSASTYGATDYQRFLQVIEGYNVADLGGGSAAATSVTLSFWVKSSLVGTFGGYFSNGDESRLYVFQYTINSANTWEYKTVTIAGCTTGTWATDNTAGARVAFSLGGGSSRATSSPNTWLTSYYQQATGNVSLGANAGATWQVTGVQLEAGSVATPFERRSYGLELALCQRYYEVVNVGGSAALAMYTRVGGGYFYGQMISFAVPKRASPTMPTVTSSSYWVEPGIQAFSSNTTTSFEIMGVTTSGFGYRSPRIAGNSNPVNNNAYMWEGSITFTASAEL